MQYKQVDKDYFIYIEKNEKVMDTLTRFCMDQAITNAKISGIGAVKQSEIGAYDTVGKEYIRKQFPDVWELVSYEGNVTLKDGDPFVHGHVVLSNHDMKTIGGHLFETTVAAVGEFFLRKFDNDAYREINEDVGLPCICLEHKF
ncbi:MAG: PPC domain-containing DNA-binding protein [Candidatus Neomarinimicrobiota bacterium]|nr:PPC domain-containing DNA-binding protein [Candidatus Neomarinimicrobiota bacterium]